MQAILLAGGHATRLWPITRHRPKPLLPLGSRTILDRLLDQVAPLADEVLVSTNAKFASAFEEAIEGVPGARLVVEKQASEAEKPGALGAIFQLTEELTPREDLLVVAGDNHYGFDLTDFIDQAGEHTAPTVAVKALPEREQARQFGVVELAEGSRIEAFHEKPEDPPSNLAATALYHYPAGWDELFQAYEKAAKASANPEEMFDAPGRILEWAVDQGRPVHAWPFEDPWYDIGTAEGYLEALAEVVGPRFVEGELEECTEGPGVYVFGDARAYRSRLERTVLLPGARVEDAELTGCIVDNDAHVRSLALEGSLVGEHDELNGPGER